MSLRPVGITVNGRLVQREIEPRRLLTDFLRDDLGLTGTNVGCEHGACGACTVHVDGEPVRGCLMLAVQADGRAVTTVEGLAASDGELHPLQHAFHEEHALQCGFCTPGFLMTLEPVVRDAVERRAELDDDTIRHALSGNLCRCTGYQNIVRAVRRAVDLPGPSADERRGSEPGCSHGAGTERQSPGP